MPSWLLATALTLGLVMVVVYFRTLPQLALAEEDYRWQGVFRTLWESGRATSLFGTSTGSYRPLCGALLLVEDGAGLGATAKFLVSALLHLTNLTALGLLVSRVYGSRAGVLAALTALCWSSANEVLASLGARCDLLSVTLGLVASHAALSALRTPRAGYLFALLAALGVGCAALVKETAFAFPLLWLIYAHATRAPRWRYLLPASALALLLLLARTVISRGLGSYVDHYVDRGLLAFAANTIKALGALALGSGPPAGPLLSVLAAIPALIVLSWLLTRQIFAKARAHLALAFALVLAPIGLLFAARTLYPVVILLAALVAVASADGTRANRAALALALALQVASGTVGLHRWERAYAARRAAIAEVAAVLRPGERGLLIAPRAIFAGKPLGAVCTDDLAERRVVTRVCTPRPVVRPATPRLVQFLAPRDESHSAAYEIKVDREAPCDFRFRPPIGLSCLPAESAWVDQRSLGRGEVQLTPATADLFQFLFRAGGRSRLARTDSCSP